MESDGVCYVPGVMTDASSRKLYKCLQDELAKAYSAVERDSACSISRFNVPVETHDPLRGYLLLPLRDEQSVIDGVADGPLVSSLRELLSPGAKLGTRHRGGVPREQPSLLASAGRGRPTPSRCDHRTARCFRHR